MKPDTEAMLTMAPCDPASIEGASLSPCSTAYTLRIENVFPFQRDVREIKFKYDGNRFIRERKSIVELQGGVLS
jgi:hypothetical protein